MITWVNSAKGIGIILVIFGHLLYSSNLQGLNQIIYAFHIPLFLFYLDMFKNVVTLEIMYYKKYIDY